MSVIHIITQKYIIMASWSSLSSDPSSTIALDLELYTSVFVLEKRKYAKNECSAYCVALFQTLILSEVVTLI